VAEDADAELAGVDAHEPGDSRTGASRERAPAAEGAASIEPAGMAEEATMRSSPGRKARPGVGAKCRRESARLRVRQGAGTKRHRKRAGSRRCLGIAAATRYFDVP